MIQNVSHIVYIVVSTIFSTLMVSLNIPSMMIFVNKMRIASLSVLILANICACDMFVCIISNNFYIFNISTPPLKWNTGPTMCKLFKTFTMMTNISQILSLAVICHDRMNRLTCSKINQWGRKQGTIFLGLIWCVSAILTLPRLFLFDEKRMQGFSTQLNTTEVQNTNCKPIDTSSIAYIACTSALFVFGYALPSAWIVITLFRCQWVTCRHARMMKSALKEEHASPVVRMNQQLALAFNLLGVLYVMIWTPFFVMSMLDLELNLLTDRNLIDLNFALRCTLLVLGSGKPLIYIACLPKFRKEMCLMFRMSKKPIPDDQSDVVCTAFTESSGKPLSNGPTVPEILSSDISHANDMYE